MPRKKKKDTERRRDCWIDSYFNDKAKYETVHSCDILQ